MGTGTGAGVSVGGGDVAGAGTSVDGAAAGGAGVDTLVAGVDTSGPGVDTSGVGVEVSPGLGSGTVCRAVLSGNCTFPITRPCKDRVSLLSPWSGSLLCSLWARRSACTCMPCIKAHSCTPWRGHAIVLWQCHGPPPPTHLVQVSSTNPCHSVQLHMCRSKLQASHWLTTIGCHKRLTEKLEVATVSMTSSPKMDVILTCAGRMSGCELIAWMTK